MKLLRLLAISVILLLLIAVAALWWNRPGKTDMADYAPADSLVYIEVDSLPDVIKAIRSSDVWKSVAATVGSNTQPQSSWSLLASRTGLAPTEAVLSSRAQFALVVLGIDATEKDEQLHVKPEVALIVETHTANWRMKATAIENIKRLADFAYGTSVCSERSAEVHYVDCLEKQGPRKIVAAIDGSIITIANSDEAIKKCLGVRRGQRPSLRTDPELASLRRNLKSDSALAFGYVSQLNAARLVSLAGPLLLGKAPGDQQLEQLLSKSSAKILRSIAWVSTPSRGGIEDRYHIALDPDVVKRLEPAFDTATPNEDFWQAIPDAFRSLTIYRSKNPQAAWSSLDSAFAIKLDAVSSVIFAALLKASLTGYGIDDPKTTIGALSSPLVTLRPVLGEGSLLIGKIADESQLRRAISSALIGSGKGQLIDNIRIEPNSQKEFTALLLDGFLIMGKTEDVAVYLAQVRNKEMISNERLESLKLSNRRSDSAIVTYTNERSSFAGIIRSLSLLNSRRFTENELDKITNSLTNHDCAWTESAMDSSGIDRRTQSAFGQFGNLLSFAQDSSSPRP